MPLEPHLKQALRGLLDWNCRASLWESSLAARLGRRDGLDDFRRRVLAGLLAPGLRVLDVGGGKLPAFAEPVKREWGLHVVGLDVSRHELEQAAPGAYDERVVGDVATVRFRPTFDLIVSRFVLEHVRNTPAALANMAAALRPGGVMAHLLPSSRAGYAIVNRLIGNRLARGLLHALYPACRPFSGFEAYYDHCTPGEMSGLCHDEQLKIVELTPYYRSDYFRFCLPIHTLEVGRQLLCMKLGIRDLAESFALVARKPAEVSEPALLVTADCEDRA
jgi:SAM-dependent methyltransferase